MKINLGRAETRQRVRDERRDERRARWALYANIGLGLWLASSPLIYDSMTTQSVGEAARFVTVDRGLPSIEWRASALAISDVVSGLAIALFGALSLAESRLGFLVRLK